MGQEDFTVHAQIVVVEDNPDDAGMTLRALGMLDPPPLIRLVRDGAAALELLVGEDACRPEVVFLDLKMPKVHGLEVLRILREDPDSRMLPIVVFTSSDALSDIAKATALGANEYICKPLDWDLYFKLVCGTAAKYVPSAVSKG